MSEEKATTPTTPPPPMASSPVTLLRPPSLEEQVTEMLGRKPTPDELRQAVRLKMEAERIERGELSPAGGVEGVPVLEFRRLTPAERLAADERRRKEQQEYNAFLTRMGAWVAFALYGAPQPAGTLSPSELKFVKDTILSIEEARALEPYLILNAQNLYTAMVYGVRIAQEQRIQAWETVAILVAASASVAALTGGLATWLGPELGLGAGGTKSLVSFATWSGLQSGREMAKDLTKAPYTPALTPQERDQAAERYIRDQVLLFVICFSPNPDTTALALLLQLKEFHEE